MSKKNKHKKLPQSPAPAGTITMTPEQLKNVIAQAIVEADRLKEQQEHSQKNEYIIEMRERIHMKDYSQDKHRFRGIRQTANIFCSMVRMLHTRGKNIKGLYFFPMLVKMILSFFFLAAECLLFALALFCFGFSIFTLSAGFLQFIRLGLFFVVYAFISYMFAQLFRISAVEIEKLEDNNFLLGILGAVLALLALAPVKDIVVFIFDTLMKG